MSQPQRVQVEGVWRPLKAGGQPMKECCCGAAECCMYPAGWLGVDGGYVIADLPEDLSLLLDDDGTPFTVGKISPVSFPSFDDYTYYTGYYLGSGYYVALCVEGDRDAVYWVIGIESEGFLNVVRLVGGCLITGDGNLEPGNDRVEDQFEPSYTLTIYPSWGGSIEVPVTRESLCVWHGLSSACADVGVGDIIWEAWIRYSGTGFYVEFGALIKTESEECIYYDWDSDAAHNGYESSPTGQYDVPDPNPSSGFQGFVIVS